MFDAAKNFVIQHGVFIEVRDNARLYASKLCKHPRSKTSNSPLDARFSKYRRIRQGDIKLVDSVGKYWQPQNTDDAHDDYIVEVAGENRKRMARFYNGESAYARFEIQLDVLSNLMHPRIAQVFGVCYPTDSPGMIFHDDGMYRGFSEFALSLGPFRRAAFCMKYTEEYFDATSYL
ncbi:hypothetical protein BDQ17DRAFT_184342 [Cyathus striatus]|nr:hypothetical protein BDQ17DRAFT_184342 [Cyathus striatus]